VKSLQLFARGKYNRSLNFPVSELCYLMSWSTIWTQQPDTIKLGFCCLVACV